MLLTACLLFASCDKESPARFREHLQGTWLLNSYDGMEVPLDEYMALTFKQISFSTKGRVTCYGVVTAEDSVGRIYHQWGSNIIPYDVYCCDLKLEGIFEGLLGHLTPMPMVREYNYLESTDSTINMELVYYSMGGVEAAKPYSVMSMDKLPLDYAAADSIYGVWQFKTRNGAEFTNCRIQFKPDGALNFEFRIGENEWQATSTEDYYNLYNDFLAVTVKDNSEFGVPVTWAVKCFRITGYKETTSLELSTEEDVYTLSYISPN